MCFFIVVVQVLSLLWQLKLSIDLIMGKVEFGIYFYVTADILKKSLTEMFCGVVLYQPYEFCPNR